MNTSNEFATIEAYLFGHMTTAELVDFEKQLVNNPKLKEQVALQRLEHQAMELHVQARLKANLEQWKLEKTETKTVPLKRKRRWIPLSVAAAIAIGLTFWFMAYYYSNSALSQYYFEQHVSQALRGRFPSSSSIPTILIPGWNAIQQGNLSEGINQLKSIQDVNFRDQAQLLIGEAQYQMQAYEEAAQTFETVFQTSNFPNYKEQAEWQLALTYLTNNQTAEQGLVLIERIAKLPNHSHYPDALALLKEKRSFWGRWF